jgi:hypothetical protein
MGEHDVLRAAEPAISSNPQSRPGGTIDEAAFSPLYRHYVPTLVANLTSQGAQLNEAADIANSLLEHSLMRPRFR